jgi:hypothetical protein
MPQNNSTPVAANSSSPLPNNTSPRVQAVINASGTIFKGSETVFDNVQPVATVQPPLPSPSNQAPPQDSSAEG